MSINDYYSTFNLKSNNLTACNHSFKDTLDIQYKVGDTLRAKNRP